ncbi:hypothetical protein O0I10_004149 [Lichtheimia ornata]|uniref:RlpA-like protein double-psi beta-barrel domain-containing protein n=1 Tax=Lichtheimia ornata TaxID=688661 RepID=A0AAD7V9B3_9FUNG|nr:uncharacterized protein O0I10_004149 [Lichtheimia ornata]KAJ8660287.1 hypothetical protein O0I10_004149 [Lichtheimia ornata]
MRFLVAFLLLVSLLLLHAKVVYTAPINNKRDQFNGFFSGRITFFHPASEGGAWGACGPHENDHSRIVALNLKQYGNEDARSKWCNKKVLIMHKGKEVEATISDACPGCADESLDATPYIFSQLGVLKTGVLKVKWCVLGTRGCKSKKKKSLHHNKKDKKKDD